MLNQIFRDTSRRGVKNLGLSHQIRDGWHLCDTLLCKQQVHRVSTIVYVLSSTLRKDSCGKHFSYSVFTANYVGIVMNY